MDMNMQETVYPCLKTVCNVVQHMEQTQEIRLTEDLPDVGKIIGAWGQVITRGKEWRSDSVHYSGGVIVHILYLPENGTQSICLDSWIPLQAKWDLPDQTPEGVFTVSTLTKYIDARSVNPRKIMIRAGIAAYGQAMVASQIDMVSTDADEEGVELLRKNYPMRFLREAGEKEFNLEESLPLPVPIRQDDKPIYYCVKPEVYESKVLGNKIAFRGTCNFHILYRDGDGHLCNQDYPMNFSQFADLHENYGADAQVTFFPVVTNLELEYASDHFTAKCGIAAQYMVDDVSDVEIIEDAYCIGKQLKMETATLDVSSVLEKKVDIIPLEQSVTGHVSQIVDVSSNLDFPKAFSENGKIVLEMPGSVQILYYDDAGALQSVCTRVEGKSSLDAKGKISVLAFPGAVKSPQISISSEAMTLKEEVPITVLKSGGCEMNMITALHIGDAVTPDPLRPSLILRKGNEDDLWKLAKESGSTVSAIYQANKPYERGKYLLIPIF